MGVTTMVITPATTTRATPARVVIGFPVPPMAAAMQMDSAATAEASPAAAKYPATTCS